MSKEPCNNLGGGGHKNGPQAPESGVPLRPHCMSDLQHLHHRDKKMAVRQVDPPKDLGSGRHYLMQHTYSEGQLGARGLYDCWNDPAALSLTHLTVLVVVAPQASC